MNICIVANLAGIFLLYIMKVRYHNLDSSLCIQCKLAQLRLIVLNDIACKFMYFNF